MNYLMLLSAALQGVTTVRNQSQLQTALDAVATAEPNVLGGTHQNRSLPIVVKGTIALTEPLSVPGNAQICGYGSGSMLTYAGTDAPISFYSAVGNGASGAVLMDGLTIYAPSAVACWNWDRANHLSNAGSYTFKNLRLTAAGVHMNVYGPGDGRFYSPWFENIECFGVGKMVGGVDANGVVQGGTPIDGMFVRTFYVNNACAYSFAIDLAGGEARFYGGRVEPTNAGIIRMTGSFGVVDFNMYHEPQGTCAIPYSIDGTGNVFTSDSIYFLKPDRALSVSGGAKVRFRAEPNVTDNGGGHVDFATITTASTADLATIRAAISVTGSGSSVTWPGGRMRSGTPNAIELYSPLTA